MIMSTKFTLSKGKSKRVDRRDRSRSPLEHWYPRDRRRKANRTERRCQTPEWVVTKRGPRVMDMASTPPTSQLGHNQ